MATVAMATLGRVALAAAAAATAAHWVAAAARAAAETAAAETARARRGRRGRRRNWRRRRRRWRGRRRRRRPRWRPRQRLAWRLLRVEVDGARCERRRARIAGDTHAALLSARDDAPGVGAHVELRELPRDGIALHRVVPGEEFVANEGAGRGDAQLEDGVAAGAEIVVKPVHAL